MVCAASRRRTPCISNSGGRARERQPHRPRLSSLRLRTTGRADLSTIEFAGPSASCPGKKFAGLGLVEIANRSLRFCAQELTEPVHVVLAVRIFIACHASRQGSQAAARDRSLVGATRFLLLPADATLPQGSTSPGCRSTAARFQLVMVHTVRSIHSLCGL